jgi:hypothetical protein
MKMEVLEYPRVGIMPLAERFLWLCSLRTQLAEAYHWVEKPILSVRPLASKTPALEIVTSNGIRWVVRRKAGYKNLLPHFYS